MELTEKKLPWVTIIVVSLVAVLGLCGLWYLNKDNAETEASSKEETKVTTTGKKVTKEKKTTVSPAESISSKEELFPPASGTANVAGAAGNSASVTAAAPSAPPACGIPSATEAKLFQELAELKSLLAHCSRTDVAQAKPPVKHRRPVTRVAKAVVPAPVIVQQAPPPSVVIAPPPPPSRFWGWVHPEATPQNKLPCFADRRIQGMPAQCVSVSVFPRMGNEDEVAWNERVAAQNGIAPGVKTPQGTISATTFGRVKVD